MDCLCTHTVYYLKGVEWAEEVDPVEVERSSIIIGIWNLSKEEQKESHENNAKGWNYCSNCVLLPKLGGNSKCQG